MKIIVGIGNYGSKYENTRHNAGFILLDEIQKNERLSSFCTFKNSLISKNSTYILVKPQTYMNLSGVAIKEILNFYKLTTCDVLVIYDEANINVGKFKISFNSGSGGHNGVKNILQEVGNCLKLRIGISNTQKQNQIIGDFVLGNFSPEDLVTIKNLSEKVWAIIQSFADEKTPEQLMNQFNNSLE